MNIIIVEQNEVKSYLILSSGILYIKKEESMVLNSVNITFYFSGGQTLKIPIPKDRVDEVYLDLLNQLGAGGG